MAAVLPDLGSSKVSKFDSVKAPAEQMSDSEIMDGIDALLALAQRETQIVEQGSGKAIPGADPAQEALGSWLCKETLKLDGKEPTSPRGAATDALREPPPTPRRPAPKRGLDDGPITLLPSPSQPPLIPRMRARKRARSLGDSSASSGSTGFDFMGSDRVGQESTEEQEEVADTDSSRPAKQRKLDYCTCNQVVRLLKKRTPNRATIQAGVLEKRECGAALRPITPMLAPRDRELAIIGACNAYLGSRVGMKKKLVFKDLNEEIGDPLSRRKEAKRCTQRESLNNVRTRIQKRPLKTRLSRCCPPKGA